MPPVLAAITGVDTVPLLPAAPVGLEGLHLLLRPEIAGSRDSSGEEAAPRLQSGLGELVQQIEAGGPGVVMTMGKGGVGKTTVAAAIAVALAARGHQVTLTTTDPAAHVADALPDPPRNLTVTRIDPAA
jgi:arsenite-transporting ATPase